MYCEACGEEPDTALEQCPLCRRLLCELCWVDRTNAICDRCERECRE